jgi:DsbC/DsbD-like thiol-disulfide interchange protein
VLRQPQIRSASIEKEDHRIAEHLNMCNSNGGWRLAACLFVLAAGLWLVPGLRAQTEAPVVEARMLLATDAVHPGATAKAAVVVHIPPGYHINDHKPSLDYLIPTELTLDPSKQFQVTKIDYPKGDSVKLAFSDTPLSVYQGRITLDAVFRVARETPPGSYTVKGKFAYQACNDHACFPPTAIPVTLGVKVVGRDVPLKQVNADVLNSRASN